MTTRSTFKMQTKIYLCLLCIIGSFFASNNALAFTIKGIRAGATIAELKERFPNVVWEDTGFGALLATLPFTTKETIGGSRINAIRAFNQGGEVAHKIWIEVQCATNPRDFSRLMISNFGKPYSITNDFYIITWQKNRQTMILQTGYGNPVDTTCHLIELLDEAATIEHLKELEAIQKMIQGNPKDF